MSITFRTYIHENDFVTYNPWFDLAVRNRLSNYYDDKLKYKVRDEIESQFPGLWLKQMNPGFDALKSQLNDRAHVHLNTLANETKTHVNTINHAAENKVQELMNSPDFAPLKENITTALTVRYNSEEDHREQQFKKAEKNRDSRLNDLQSTINEVKTTSWLSFFGGIGVGIGLSLFRR